MRVRWTTDAAEDLERICDFIAKDRPESARRVAETIVQGVGALDTFPERGRRGRVEGTRELVFASLPLLRFMRSLNTFKSCEFCMEHNGGRRPEEHGNGMS